MFYKICKWNDIKSEFKDGSLLIGNGASIEVCNKFAYKNLFEEAKRQKFITDEVNKLFEKFNTENFELILKHLSRASIVTKILGNNAACKTIDLNYKHIKIALQKTICSIHPEIKDKEKFDKFSDDGNFRDKIVFLKSFRTIYNLNYDVILYWVLLWADWQHSTNKKDKIYDVKFKDCFISNKKKNILDFENKYERFRESLDDREVTLVFYPHGNIILANNSETDEFCKIKADDKQNLLKTIYKKWDDNYLTPLIICEGSSDEKHKAILKNSYTNLIFENILPSAECELNRTMVFLGWSLDKSDQHI